MTYEIVIHSITMYMYTLANGFILETMSDESILNGMLISGDNPICHTVERRPNMFISTPLLTLVHELRIVYKIK